MILCQARKENGVKGHRFHLAIYCCIKIITSLSGLKHLLSHNFCFRNPSMLFSQSGLLSGL